MTAVIEDLPSIAEVVRRHALSPKKSLGQNFLFDLNLTSRIARAAGPLEGRTVVEIGPGPGALTRALLIEGADHVIAIDLDPRVEAVMAEISEACRGHLTFLNQDALTYSPSDCANPKLIVANLPYNIGTRLLTHWLTPTRWPSWFSGMVLMFQKEVADRITAPVGSKAYGRLSVLSQWRTNPESLFEINPQAFVPPPKVTSTVVRFDVIDQPPPVPLHALETVTAAAFNQRRKMLRQSLKAIAADPIRLLTEADIEPTRRAETLEVAEFVRLANAYAVTS
ncbi:MAG: 16S rRNA (adenine(1518)-N(6)/adenine(1519)-N(6))-dimethyltransferase RsmA [Pseudomonadota bacterium]